MRNQRGTSLPELLAVLVVLTMGLTASTRFTHSWIERQSARNAVYQLQSFLRLTRVHAITRTRDCRFVIDEATRTIRIFDLDNPGDDTDDIELGSLTLNPVVRFERPDPGDPITLSPLGGTEYQATFTPRGSVSAGAGLIVVRTGEDGYRKITLFGAGGLSLERWDGSAWVSEF